jgi:hypothetical protein
MLFKEYVNDYERKQRFNMQDIETHELQGLCEPFILAPDSLKNIRRK